MFDFIVKFFLVLSVLGWIPGQNTIFYDKNFFLFSSITILVSSFLFKTKNRLLNVNCFQIFSYLSFIALLNCYISGFTNVNYITSFILFLVNILLIYKHINDYKSCIKWIVIAAIINILIFFSQAAGFNPIFPDNKGFYGGHLGNLARFSTYLAIVFPFLLDYGVVTFIIAIATFFFGAQKQLTIIGAAYLTLFFRLKGRLIKILYILPLCFIFVFFYDKIYYSIFTVRFPVWENLYNIFIQYPIFGIGMSWSLFSDATRDFQCQSSYFYYIIGCGAIGIIPIILMIKYFIKNFKTTSLNISLTIILLLSAIEYPFEIRRIWFTLTCIIAFYLIETSERIYNENSICKV